MKLMIWFISAIIVLATLYGVVAVPGADFADPCYFATWYANGDLTRLLKIVNSCQHGNYVQWTDDLNLTILGNVTDGEVVIADFVFADSSLRPDLNANATLVFNYLPFVEPLMMRDGIVCFDCNVSRLFGSYSVKVNGFSNYSFQARRDFTVYFDNKPELKRKVYITIDLGDNRRNQEYACIVQIFGRNSESNTDWVLVQANPQRDVQARILGYPDTTQPESLGYFSTKNGIANAYFMGDQLFGYSEFNLVAQCTANASPKLVYEESISTRYSPSGRALVGRGLWLTDGSNAFYLSIYIIGGIILIWIALMIIRSFFR